jgi:hypothetical protein
MQSISRPAPLGEIVTTSVPGKSGSPVNVFEIALLGFISPAHFRQTSQASHVSTNSFIPSHQSSIVAPFRVFACQPF